MTETINVNRVRSVPDNLPLLLFVHLLVLFFVCEYAFYYLKLGSQCTWPKDIVRYGAQKPVNALILADTHLLGPYRGHWWDRFRREWQMHRGFQSAMTLFRPQLVVFLGDLFDEGEWVTDKEFEAYVQRFQMLFYTPDDVKVVGVVGNHDIGFHYATRPGVYRRFGKHFRTTGVDLFTMHEGVHFVSINSVAMQGDGCELCAEAEQELLNISRILKCSRGIGKHCANVSSMANYSPPIILQHYPMYRESDADCEEHDSLTVEGQQFRETWEVLSQEATDLIGDLLEPRLAFSGHSHDYCRLMNRLKIEEYTIPSFSWRNRDNPAFALAKFTEKDYSVNMCQLPRESTMIWMYVAGTVVALLNAIRCACKTKTIARKVEIQKASKIS